jgi:ubiquitin-protein ligase E3 D
VVHPSVPQQLEYIAEEQRNLGSITVRAWFKSSMANPPNSGSPADLRSRQVNSSRRLDQWAVVDLVNDGRTLVLHHVPSRTDVRLRLPTQAAPLSTPPPSPTVYSDDHLELRLITDDAMSSTRSRADLEVPELLSARDLCSARPTSFVCASCGIEIVDARDVSRYVALPSDHWAELLEAWMCHVDHGLSEEVILANSGQRWPADEREVLVGTAHLLFDAKETSNWTSDARAKVGVIFLFLWIFGISPVFCLLVVCPCPRA